MRGLTLDGIRTISYREDLPVPVLIDTRDAIVAVTAAGLCGSDLHPYEGRERVRFGVVQGHEIVGTVTEVGVHCSLRIGDRVAAAFTTSCGSCEFCRSGLSARCASSELFGYASPDDDSRGLGGGQAGLARIPLADTTAVRLPDSVDDLQGVLLTDNFPTAWYAAARADIVPKAPVAVVGLGSVGLCAVVAAFAHGAGDVLAVDLVAERRVRAERLGAKTASPADLGPELGSFSSVIEAAGAPAAQRLAFDLLRPGGTLSVIAVQTAGVFAFTPVEAYDRNLTVRAGRAPVRSVLDELLPRVEAGDVSVPADVVVTHPAVDLAEGPETYRAFSAREDGIIKVVFRP